MIFVRLLLTFCLLPHITGQFGNRLSKYIRHYEGLSYNTEVIHSRHQRVRRALSPRDMTVNVEFQAHGRDFNLRLRRDASVFSPDVVIEVSGDEAPVDTSHIYSGEISGEKGTLIHGSLVNGRFEGFIKTHQGTYYVEPSERYMQDKEVPYHSVIYHEDDINYPHKYGAAGSCADHSVFDRMRRYQATAVEETTKEVSRAHKEESFNGPVILRRKRAVDRNFADTCQLFIQTDHKFYELYKTRENVIAQISSHVKAIDTIYKSTKFLGSLNVHFVVKRIRINTTANVVDPTNPFRFSNIGVEKFLDLNSEQNHDNYCLAYVFTDRDFDDGVLGLAWVAVPSGSAGGICERNKLYSDGKRKSLNTGIITVQNYATRVPPKVSHITFAHEVGHNFGAKHDSGIECTPGESKVRDEKERGNFIMYARATSGDKPNNNKFSGCSIRNMSAVLVKKKDLCFIESGLPICGNGIVEDGEQCDCGYSDECTEQCCHSADSADSEKCKLRDGKVCSPSQGPCCTETCDFKGSSDQCRKESECAHECFCNGATAQCPSSEPKENLTVCHKQTQVCLSGVCSGSICDKFSLEECTCAIKEGKDEAAELCHVCCMERSDPSTCSSTASERWARFFNKTVITLQPGSPCNDFTGYCDVFMKCRLVDADGPLARLKKAIFNAELYETIAEWVVGHWWAVLLAGIVLIMLMAGFIKICSVHTPSSNPKLPPPKPLPGTLRRRRPRDPQYAQDQQRPRMNREDYQMGQMRR